MSGGHWDYVQYRIKDVPEDIESIIEKNGIEWTIEESKKIHTWADEQHIKDNKHLRFEYDYPEDVIEEFKKGAEIIKKAYIYMQRIDWLLSGDDGEDNFLTRLKDDLSKL